MVLTWYSVKVNGIGVLGLIDGVMSVSPNGTIEEFFNASDLTRSVLFLPGTFEGNDNYYEDGLTANGLGLCSVPVLDNNGTNMYNLYSEGGDYFLISGIDGAVIDDEILDSVTFTGISEPAFKKFKAKAMNYADYLRTKKEGATKVISTRPKMDASDYTQRQRFAAAQIFAKDGQRIGVVNTSMELTQDPLKAVNSYKKGSGGRVGDASAFTAFRGGQAIGGLVQSGMPPDRIVQEPVVYFDSKPVSQRASDITRRVQGCKVSLGEQHDPSSLTASVFVDDTIRNIGGGAVCRDVPAIHVSEKADVPFPTHPDRPSQAGGQYALKGDLAPGKDVAAFGGNAHYKVGAALKNIPYVEKHHGNDLGVNPKRPFVKYQIPKGTPAHLKINDPKRSGGYEPPISITNIASLTSPGVYTLNISTVILPGQTLTIPVGITLQVPAGLVLTNNGTLECFGTINNAGTITITSTGIVINAGTMTNSGTSTLTNSGTITNSGTLTGDNGITYTNTGTNTNTGTFVITQLISTYVAFDTPNNRYTVSSNLTIPIFVTIGNGYNVFISSGATFTNNGTIDNAPYFITIEGTFVNTSFGTLLANNHIYNTGTLTNNGILTNTSTIYNSDGGTITNNGTYSGGGDVNNADGSGACGTGTLNGTTPLTATGSTCP